LPIASADRDRSRAGIRSFAALVCVALGTVGAPVSADTGREVYVIDPAASEVRVHLGRAGLLKFMGHDHEIDAPIARGRIEVDPDEPTASGVDLSWDASLLAIVPGTEPEKDVPVVEERMRGPEVLDVEQHGEVRFWSFEIEVRQANPAAGRWQLLVRGGLQIKGARHTVEVPLVVRRQGDELTAAGEATLRLRRLGIDPPSVAGVVKVSDEFRLTFDVRAFREGGAGEEVSHQVR
jgi:polyisoprenoid-binding protein YceI